MIAVVFAYLCLVAGPSKSSLGKRKRKPTRDEAPLVQRKRARRIRESSDDDDYSSAAENITSQVKTSRKKNKSKKPTPVKPSETHSSNPRMHHSHTHSSNRANIGQEGLAFRAQRKAVKSLFHRPTSRGMSVHTHPRSVPSNGFKPTTRICLKGFWHGMDVLSRDARVAFPGTIR